MNQQMWKNTATQENCKKISGRGIRLLGPAEGLQACGETGPGRLLDIEDIRNQVRELFSSGLLAGQRVVITAGPTREALDPVRYLSNHSSGKMGYALAQAALDAGASVCLISGPTNLAPPDRVEFIPVISAADMHGAALREAHKCTIFIAAAAVADFRPATVAAEKIKKGASDSCALELVKNPDIVADVRKQFPKLFVAGFAAETHDMEKNARDKLARKNLDMVIANDVSRSDIGFGSEQNAVTVFLRNQDAPKTFDVMNKSLLARHLVELMASTVSRS
jgi:phosphopantothenoylcysteine decarboxylase/phosphopantothenate--cysteine ligase